jgi:hypothetical protein
VFISGLDNALWHIWQTSAGGGWSSWTSLSGVLADDPKVGTNSDGRLQVFVHGSDNGLWSIAQSTAGGWN